MRWIVLAIVVFVAGYTVVTLVFRKPGAAYQPYQTAKDKAVAARLEAVGFVRVLADAARPADPARERFEIGRVAASPTDAPGGWPEEIAASLIDRPTLPLRVSAARAPGEIDANVAYTVSFACAWPDHKRMLTDSFAYVKTGQLVFAPQSEPIDGDLLARSPQSSAQLTLPAGALRPGRYDVTLLGAQTSQRWTLLVH
jgi:hypothetical protein